MCDMCHQALKRVVITKFLALIERLYQNTGAFFRYILKYHAMQNYFWGREQNMFSFVPFFCLYIMQGWF